MAELASLLASLLVITIISAAVRFITDSLPHVSYSVTLMTAGVLLSVLGVNVGITLTSEIILLIILPVILFFATLEVENEDFRKNFPAIFLYVGVGTPIGVVLAGWIGSHVLGIPLIASLLLAAIIYPVDPAAVVSLYRDMDAPERLIALSEGEATFQDGVAVVIFSAILALFQKRFRTGRSLDILVDPVVIGQIILDGVVSTVGGILVGGLFSYLVLRGGTKFVDEPMEELLYTIILVFGTSFLAHHYLHVSGVLAAVTVGLITASMGERHTLSEGVYSFLESVWSAVEFLLRALLFVLIGVEVPIGDVAESIDLVLIASGIILAVRAVSVYSLTAVANRVLFKPVPLNYQHIIVWGSMHTSITIALLLSLPDTIPYFTQLRAIVFGVVVVSVIMQGLLMPVVLYVTGVVDPSWLQGSGQGG